MKLNVIEGATTQISGDYQMNKSQDVFEQATEAAKQAGAICPEAVAEYIQGRLSVVDTVAGPTVMARNGLELESLDAAMVRLKQTDGVLFAEEIDASNIDHDLYLAIRKHRPELLGLRPKRQ